MASYHLYPDIGGEGLLSLILRVQNRRLNPHHLPSPDVSPYRPPLGAIGRQPLGQPSWEISSSPASHLWSPSPAWLLEPTPASPQQVPGARYTGPLSPPLSYRPVAHQGDEVGEGELQADVDHVRITLSGPQVGVVVVHQVPEQTLLLVPALGSCNRQY